MCHGAGSLHTMLFTIYVSFLKQIDPYLDMNFQMLPGDRLSEVIIN